MATDDDYRCECGWAGSPEAVLDAVSGLNPALHTVCGACPQCKGGFEAQPAPGVLGFGHSYFGGAMHFEVTREIRAAGLRVVRPSADEMEIVLGSRHWIFAGPASSSEWMYVFPNGEGPGKTIGELRFADLGARVTELQLDFTALPFDATTRLRGGERLLVVGRYGALRRAWARLHEGRD